MIEAIRDYVKKCPFLDELSNLDVDYLDHEATNYSINALPGDTVIKKYADGGEIRQYNFAVSSRSFYGKDVKTNIENLDFFFKFGEWVEGNNKNKVFPKLAEKSYPQEVKVLTDGYLLSADMETGRYQVQCKLIYYKEV